MSPPVPPKEIVQLMRFIATKTKNVTSPINMMELCRQFKENTGSLVSERCLRRRIDALRLKIHLMTEFDMETKVKMVFAVSTPIDEGFLEELKRVADVELDDQQRIIHYKQKDGGLELSGGHYGSSMTMENQRNREIIQLLAEKAETTDTPIADNVFLREFKEKTACPDSIETLVHRYRRVKNTIYQSSEIDKNTKIKMMFISNVKLPDDVLKKLRKNADIEVDEEGRITKYRSKDGSLELEGSHGKSTSMKSNNGSLELKRSHEKSWHSICKKINEVVSEKNDEIDANWQTDFERERIYLVRFLIERTKNATRPLNIKQLVKDYKTKFKNSESPNATYNRIRRFRPQIHEMNEFDKPTKVKMLFVLSSSIDAEFLKELQKDAIVELDEKHRIKKYKANNGSLELEGNHSRNAKLKAGLAEMKKRRVVKDSSESEDDGDEEESISESDGSDEEEARGNVGESSKSKQAPTSSSVRKSDRLQKSKTSLRNKNKKMQLSEKNSNHTPNHARMSRGQKRARISYSSSETSEEKPSEESDDEESEKSEDDIAMDSETNNINNAGDDFDQLSYHYYNERDDAEDMDHIPAERKPDSLIEFKTEVPEELSNLEYGLIEPKIEECTREIKQEAEEKDEEGPSTTSSLNVSLLEFLTHFRRPAIKFGIPFVANNIDREIEKLKENDQQIPINTIIESLETCIQILKTPDETHSDKVTISLSDFVDHLGSSMCYIAHPLMNELQRKLGKLVATEDQKIPIEHIRYAMEETLDKILH